MRISSSHSVGFFFIFILISINISEIHKWKLLNKDNWWWVIVHFYPCCIYWVLHWCWSQSKVVLMFCHFHFRLLYFHPLLGGHMRMGLHLPPGSAWTQSILSTLRGRSLICTGTALRLYLLHELCALCKQQNKAVSVCAEFIIVIIGHINCFFNISSITYPDLFSYFKINSIYLKQNEGSFCTVTQSSKRKIIGFFITKWHCAICFPVSRPAKGWAIQHTLLETVLC